MHQTVNAGWVLVECWLSTGSGWGYVTIYTGACQVITHCCAYGVLLQVTFNYFGRTHGMPEDLIEEMHALLASRMDPVQSSHVQRAGVPSQFPICLYPKMLEEWEVDEKHFGRSRFFVALSNLRTILSPQRPCAWLLILNGKLQRMRGNMFLGKNAIKCRRSAFRHTGRTCRWPLGWRRASSD